MENASKVKHSNHTSTSAGTKSEASALTVSENTRNFIDCLILLNDFYGKVYNSISAMYGEIEADKIMGSEYSSKHQAVKAFLFDYMSASIEDNIGNGQILFEI
ncbi:MAG: hypothetical protein LBL13_07710 [Bacteroidales bacterium]|nr:hypothetical protein [Bacteroidales bacterium]